MRASLCILLWALSAGAAAQTVPPHLVAPKVPQVFGAPVPAPERPASTPTPRSAMSGQPEVTLDGVVVDGDFDEMRGALDALWSRVKGRRLSVAEVAQAIDEYQRAYEAAGFLLARVITPPQTLTDRGLLKLVVIDGFIESVETSGLPERLRGVVADRLAPVVGQHKLRGATIERQMMLLANLPGVRLRSALARGTQRGGVRLIVSGSYAGATGSVQVDNRLPRSLGTWEASLSMAANELFGWGEKFYAAGVGGLRPQGQGLPVRSLIAGAALPIGVNGLVVNVELTDSQSRQRTEPGAPATLGRFDRLAVRAGYPWRLDRCRRVDLRASLERVQQSITATAFDTQLNRDDYRVLRLGVEVGALQARGSYQAAAFVSRGLGGRDEAEAAASGVPLSRSGAGARFNKLDFSLHWNTAYGPQWQLDALAHGQFAGGKPLLKSEQLSLEGGADILPFPVGSFAVDSGVAARVGLSRWYAPSFASSPWRLGVFAAFGTGSLAQATAVERSRVTASALGLSLRSAPADEQARFTPYFGLDGALRRSNDPQAPKGWGVIATIGAKL